MKILDQNTTDLPKKDDTILWVWNYAGSKDTVIFRCKIRSVSTMGLSISSSETGYIIDIGSNPQLLFSTSPGDCGEPLMSIIKNESLFYLPRNSYGDLVYILTEEEAISEHIPELISMICTLDSMNK